MAKAELHDRLSEQHNLTCSCATGQKHGQGTRASKWRAAEQLQRHMGDGQGCMLTRPHIVYWHLVTTSHPGSDRQAEAQRMAAENHRPLMRTKSAAEQAAFTSMPEAARQQGEMLVTIYATNLLPQLIA